MNYYFYFHNSLKPNNQVRFIPFLIALLFLGLTLFVLSLIPSALKSYDTKILDDINAYRDQVLQSIIDRNNEYILECDGFSYYRFPPQPASYKMGGYMPYPEFVRMTKNTIRKSYISFKEDDSKEMNFLWEVGDLEALSNGRWKKINVGKQITFPVTVKVQANDKYDTSHIKIHLLHLSLLKKYDRKTIPTDGIKASEWTCADIR